MATTVTIAQDATREIDLGNSTGMSIAAPGAKASVHVDYQKPAGSGNYSSAIKGSAGYGNPFNVSAGGTKAVPKTDLESEHVRVGARDAGITVTY
ncbi:hypothetical protein ASE39_06155 [Acidovorax sp. Root267]|uniref:hypothetical protein n=1 Tax=Acidovorax sp. Root267 TaxID=1736505 RepID=UPI00070F2D3D|nr:hypothetical protein [Acidovorax sp. Root267]KRD21975.1 hypothetical protein ASE39_06155 [Acidovorax sp. Root267]